MPKDDVHRHERERGHNAEEAQNLLASPPPEDFDDDDIVVHPGFKEIGRAGASPSQSPSPQPPGPPRRISSFAQPRPDGTPRTPNRVRFDVEEARRRSQEAQANGHAVEHEDDDWMENEDYMTTTSGGRRSRRSSQGQRAPLLTDIEAPSVTLASAEGEDFNINDLLETARPKSGMKSAFMNMANSIIGAGIIGQPYAFRQAGLITGIVLLVVLTVMVDWTINLIVINSKLSGSDSFQATCEHCFGKTGLVAISIAQWAL